MREHSGSCSRRHASVGSVAGGANDHGGDALSRLLAGKPPYVAGTITHPNRRGGAGQCECHTRFHHSRAAPIPGPSEVVFARGLVTYSSCGWPETSRSGDAGSIEYAADTSAWARVVLGHSRCGAVDAALKGGDAPGHIAALVTAIAPAGKRHATSPATASTMR